MGTEKRFRQLAAPGGNQRRMMAAASGAALMGVGLYFYSYASLAYLLSTALGAKGTQPEILFSYWMPSIISIIGGTALMVIGLRR